MQIEANRSTSITIDGKDYLYFGGTNYLGLAHRRELWDAAALAFERYGFSSGASRLTSGESDLLLSLEAEFAAFLEAEASLVLPAGFMTNTAVADALNDQVDYWIVSKFAHGSIKSALAQSDKVLFVDQIMSQSGGTDRRSLRGRLGLPDCRLGFFVEPVDPLLGGLTDVANLVSALPNGDFLILDEAHSIGVLGENGRGALEHFDLKPLANIIRTGTFSKAFGAQGGFIAATKQIIDLIKSKSSSFKVSTPLTPVACAASREAIRLVLRDRENTITKLHANINYVNDALSKIGLPFEKHSVPIYHLVENPEVKRLREELPRKGLYLPTVTSYFADFCEIGLRWTVQAGHTQEQLDKLLAVITSTSPS